MIINKLKELFINISLLRFAIIAGLINLVLYHIPLFKYCFNTLEPKTFNSWLLLISLVFIIIIFNAFIVYSISLISRTFAKILWFIFFVVNALAMYFIKTFNIMLNESMVGNVLNTNTAEASSFFSSGLLLYAVVLGILPGIWLFLAKPMKATAKKAFRTVGILILSIIVLIAVNIQNIPWMHTHSEPLGSYTMPWSYVANTQRYYHHKHKNARQEILLPDASIKDSTKTVFVLVIGESARSENFSIYGYGRNTNPLLSRVSGLRHFNAEAAATYTIAGVKAILEYTPSKKLYECLPNYLHRTGVRVIWRTTNTGEPKLNIDKKQDADDLKALYPEADKNYDEILLQGLKNEIVNSGKSKTLIVLHTSTSHGPDYFNKYPKEFETFAPVSTNVELEKCKREELLNAYDNTIVYTDYLLDKIIKELKTLEEYKVAMLYVSDHGESLGENSMYMHGMEKAFAPKQQYEIPFLVWVSDKNISLKENPQLSQHHVFHSVLHFLAVDSPIYNKEMDIFD